MTMDGTQPARISLCGERAEGTGVLLVGIGSRVCGDDAVGLHLVERVGERHGVRVELWEDRDALTVAAALLEEDGPVLLVDCADMRLPPGSWRAFDVDGVKAREHQDTVSSHGFGLADAVALTRALGHERAVHVFGVQPFSVRPGETRLTAQMSELMDGLAEALWGVARALGGDRRYAVLELHGLVQGVGMRPTVARLARAAGLGGWVKNRAGSLLLRVEGPPAAVRSFVATLPSRLPAQARVERLVQVAEGPCAPGGCFQILDSDDGDRPAVVVPPDLAACPACLAEVRDPGGRRHGYAFTTCTDCGPRYSVVERTPYDRERTTLARFPLCPDCAREYADPDDRRYHAESIACPRCGPTLRALTGHGGVTAGDPLRVARAALARGEVVAVRGIGGYQLVVDARQAAAIARLRALKRRPDKPLAVMAATLEVAARGCHISSHGRAALTSAAAPIALLDLLPGADGLPAGLLAPDTDTLGVMLPTSPLHDLLLRPLDGDPTGPFDWLVVTSGNRRGEPICLTDGEAVEWLGSADLLLTHDREIAWRCDDSVVSVAESGVQVVRRARGFVPEPLTLRRSLDRCVLALGAGSKNTVALGFEDRVVLSPHIGDLDEPATLDACEALARALPRLLGRRPDAIAVDLHPDLGSTRLGERLAAELGVPLVRVQHHHAHAAACMAEHGVDEALALAWDGVGLGDDGALWGGELLFVGPGGARRLGTFAPAPLPGGDAAVREPARQLVGRLFAMGQAVGVPGVDLVAAEVWAAQCARGLNAPQSHAVGRLFDSFAALLGLAPGEVSWEGQAAVRLEAAARRWRGDTPRLDALIGDDGGLIVVDWRPMVRTWLDVGAEHEPGAWALAFHEALARAAVEQVERAVARMADAGHVPGDRLGHGDGPMTSSGATAGTTIPAPSTRLWHGGGPMTSFGAAPVALTGGVFQNRLLAGLVRDGLRAAGLRVLEHARVPPNDGGISLGQAAIAGRVS